MTWNYRIMRETRMIQGKQRSWYAVHEVYYNKKGVADGWTDALDLNGFDSVKDLQTALAMMLADSMKHPVFRPTKKRRKA